MVPYISPSGFEQYLSDPELFYRKYMVVDKEPPMLQNEPMSVGSAFDAFVKQKLCSDLGIQCPPFEDLFEAQVEPHNRDFALRAGRNVMDAYIANGAYASMLEFLQCSTSVSFAFDKVTSDTPVPMRGKPDITMNYKGCLITPDFKVNGYCSKNGVRPHPGYWMLFDGQSRKWHKDVHPYSYKDIECNLLYNMKPEWSRQLTMYNWIVTGEINHVQTIHWIEQIACSPGKIVVARHKCLSVISHSEKLWAEIQALWEIMHSDHFFRNMTREESLERCKVLASIKDAYTGEHGDYIKRITGR